MASHQQHESVTLLQRHGAESLRDDFIGLCCLGVAVTQFDKPGQDLFKRIFKNVEMINMGSRVQMGTNMNFDLRQQI